MAQTHVLKGPLPATRRAPLRRATFARPSLFAVGCIELGTLIAGIAVMLGVSGVQGVPALVLLYGGQLLGHDLAGTVLTPGKLLGILAIGPVLAAAIVLFLAATAHLFVILFVGDRNAGFGATFRAISLASAVTLVNWVPTLGLPLNLLGAWMAMHALRLEHKTSLLRAGFVAFTPVAAVLLYLVLLLVAPE